MKLYELVSQLCLRLESTDSELVSRARASWNPNSSALDGNLASLILNRIKSLLPAFDVDYKCDAYNELADSEGLDRVENDMIGLDSWISDALLDPVLAMLTAAEDGDNPTTLGRLH